MQKLEACRCCGDIPYIKIANTTTRAMYVSLGGVCEAMFVVGKE